MGEQQTWEGVLSTPDWDKSGAVVWIDTTWNLPSSRIYVLQLSDAQRESVKPFLWTEKVFVIVGEQVPNPHSYMEKIAVESITPKEEA